MLPCDRLQHHKPFCEVVDKVGQSSKSHSCPDAVKIGDKWTSEAACYPNPYACETGQTFIEPKELSGGNNGNAKNLTACTGECDHDSQCAAGLKCFQRSDGESIPGCKGSGAHREWDYCYADDPKSANVVTFADWDRSKCELECNKPAHEVGACAGLVPAQARSTINCLNSNGDRRQMFV